jgi:AmmeMemoRadiSam system protein B/AmmeMemoRadiSam system protein A
MKTGIPMVFLALLTAGLTVLVFAVWLNRPEDAARAGEPPASPPEGTAATDANPADVRPPAVAGSFYPGGKEELASALDGYLKAAPKKEFPKPIRALIVPHAGYVYSAPCAALAFRQVEGRDYDRVILIGCPHRVPVRGAAIWSKGAWETPLGRVPVDESAARAMMAASPRVRDGRDPHRPDHCLEVEVPFLQKVLRPGFAIVPVLVHAGGDDDLDALGAALRAVCDAKTLIVVSTDLTHFPSRKDAEAVDAKTVASWKTLDHAEVASISRDQMAQGIANLSCTMCGEDAVRALLKAAKGLGIAGLDVVGTANSAAVSGDDRRVVGYGAAVLWGDPPAAPLAQSGAPATAVAPAGPAGDLSDAAGRKLLAIARQTVERAAAGKPLPDLKQDDPEFQVKRGCFVTLHKKGALRGCIGCFTSDEPIDRTVQSLAIKSAMEDRRFEPVTPAEVDQLDIEISILSDIVPCPDYRTIVLGRHGVIVRKGGRSGVFLPQVATETGWSLEEFLSHLARDKAGIGAEGWKSPDAKLSTFTVQIIQEARKAGR